MTFDTYLQHFEHILKDESQAPEPYNDPEYFQYTKMNWSRMNRWLKTGMLLPELEQFIKSIRTKQHWVVITEPWCGDAAHSVPFTEMLARLNDHISITYELRDAEPYRIDQYLTNGGKSIPIIIFKDENGNDFATWGPRPNACQELFVSMKKEGKDFEDIKIAIQNWYNDNKGLAVQEEILSLLSGNNIS